VAFLGGEDLVGFCRGDGEGTGDCCEFGFFDEAASIWLVMCYLDGGWGLRRMSEEADINAFSFCNETNGVFCSLCLLH
jgi:hypothetical protein